MAQSIEGSRSNRGQDVGKQAFLYPLSAIPRLRELYNSIKTCDERRNAHATHGPFLPSQADTVQYHPLAYRSSRFHGDCFRRFIRGMETVVSVRAVNTEV